MQASREGQSPFNPVGQLVESLVPSQWPKVVQKVELHVSLDRSLAACALVLSFGAAASGLLWSSGYLLRAIREFRADPLPRTDERPLVC